MNVETFAFCCFVVCVFFVCGYCDVDDIDRIHCKQVLKYSQGVGGFDIFHEFLLIYYTVLCMRVCVCVCVCVCERESVSVCVVCVCVRERRREREVDFK
jgi:hypothetical protein